MKSAIFNGYFEWGHTKAQESLPVIKSIGDWYAYDNNAVIYIADNGSVYTKKDFIELCLGASDLAFILYRRCEWQSPETILIEDGGLDSFKNEIQSACDA